MRIPSPALLLIFAVSCSSHPDPCEPVAVSSSCESAAKNIQECCSGTVGSPMGPFLAAGAPSAYCGTLAANERDAGAECSAEEKLTCGEMQGYLLTTYPEACCCPEGQFCAFDSSPIPICEPLCQTGKDCPDPTRPSCAPAAANIDGALQVVASKICVADDGATFHGCADGGCTSPGDVCGQDSEGNSFCTTPCTADQFCGGFGQGCCNASVGGSPSSACGHCGQQ